MDAALVLAAVPAFSESGMIPKRCKRPHCGGNMYLEPFDYDADGSPYSVGIDSFIGWECLCLLCARVEREYTEAQLALTWGIAPEQLERMRFSALSFLWQTGGTVAQTQRLIEEAVHADVA